MMRIPLFAAIAALVAAASAPAPASELKSQPRTSKSIRFNDAAISSYSISQGAKQGMPKQTVTPSSSGGKKPKEIVVVGSKAKKQSAGTTSVGANRTETIGASQTTSSKPKGAAAPKGTIATHGSPGATSKHKGEIEIQSFGSPQPRSK